jgi:hypothetical protein
MLKVPRSITITYHKSFVLRRTAFHPYITIHAHLPRFPLSPPYLFCIEKNINSSSPSTMGVADPPCSGYIYEGRSHCDLECILCVLVIVLSPLQTSNPSQQIEALQHEEVFGTQLHPQLLGLPRLTITLPIMTPAGARLRHRGFREPGQGGVAFQNSRSACLVHLERCLDVVKGDSRAVRADLVWVCVMATKKYHCLSYALL